MADTTRVVRIVVDAGGARQGSVQVTDALERIDRQRQRTQTGLQQLAAANANASARMIAGMSAVNDASLKMIAGMSRAGAASVSIDRIGGSSRLAGMQMLQLSQQVQDFGLQVAGGQNPFLALAQQGSQAAFIMGGFGASLTALKGVVASLTAVVVANPLLWGAAAVAAGVTAVGVAMLALRDATDDARSAQERYAEAQETARGLMEETGRLSEVKQKSLEAEKTRLLEAAQAELLRAQAFVTARQIQAQAELGAFTVGVTPEMTENDPGLRALRQAAFEAQQQLSVLNAELGVYADGRSRITETTDDIASGVEKATKKVRTFADVLADLNERGVVNAAKEYTSAIQLIEKTIESGLTDQQKYERQVAAIDRALETAAKRGYKLSIEAQRDLNQALREADPATQAAREAAEKAQKDRERLAEQNAKLLAKPFENALEGIQKGFSDFFVDVFDGGINSFKDLAAGIKGIFVRLAGELAALMVIRPTLAGVGLGGFGGFSGGIGGGGLPGMGGGTNLSSIGGDLFGLGRQLAGGTGSIGAYLFGGAPVYGNVGAAGMRGIASGVTPGLLGTGSSFLAQSFLPVIGSVLPGLIGGNFAQAGLGGLGALGGTLIGGPIGGAIGGFLGNMLGGLFGGKKKTPQAVTNISGGSGFGVGGNVIRAGGNVGATTSLADDIATAANGIVEALGGQLKNAIGGYILTSTGKNQGTVFLGGTGQYGQGGSTLSDVFGSSFADSIKGDASAVAQATTIAILKANAASGRISGLSGTESTILRNTGARDLAALNEDLSFGELYNQLIGVTKETTQAEQAIDALNKQFADARKQAAALGLNVNKLTQAQVKAIQQLTTDFNASIQDQILAITSPAELAMRELDKAQADRLANARKLGADLVEVERLSALERQRVVEQALGGLRGLYDDLSFGPLGGASPTDSLSGARAAFEAAAAQGDVAGIERYGRAFALTSRDVNASGPAFQADVERIMSVLDGQLNPAANSNMEAANQTAAASTETAATVKALLDVNREQLRANQAQAQEIARLAAAQQKSAAEAATANAQLKRLANAPALRERRGGGNDR